MLVNQVVSVCLYLLIFTYLKKERTNKTAIKWGGDSGNERRQPSLDEGGSHSTSLAITVETILL